MEDNERMLRKRKLALMVSFSTLALSAFCFVRVTVEQRTKLHPEDGVIVIFSLLSMCLCFAIIHRLYLRNR